ncbi:hypothetical protein [Metallibacterium scheffleri]|uniref:hypothetical protein n=1 Tax=Metallibacterium scheffleri TaxID=993689 RepID=UPI0010A0B93D|nr:hypothetical protein [Metallibacterium scheffleri]
MNSNKISKEFIDDKRLRPLTRSQGVVLTEEQVEQIAGGCDSHTQLSIKYSGGQWTFGPDGSGDC